ncbi:MAG: HEAT repeat domain-containing protein [Gemmataceae bacterium]
MQPRSRWNNSGGTQFSVFGVLWRVAVMLLPTGLLVYASLRTPQPHNLMLWMGTAFQALVCLLSFMNPRSFKQAMAPSVITLYLIALCWLWWGLPTQDWFATMAKAILLIVPLIVFAFQTLHDSGAPAIRRSRVLSDRLAARKEWPTDLAAIRGLPEVKALRASLTLDASPALALLTHPRLEVRVAALASLEFRKEWKPGQAELVLQTAQRAEQPMIRAAGVSALASVDDREVIERVAGFLHDPAIDVRKAAIEALLWDTENRWGWIRFSVRRALADPLFQHDGPLWQDGQMLTPEAINDLTAWAAEKGILPVRAAITLGAHYNRALTERSDRKIINRLKGELVLRTTPAILRIEIARVLQNHQELDEEVLTAMLAPQNPTPLRMIGIETVLAENTEGNLAESSIAALRDLARLPNREISLAAAAIIQRRLGVDLGLGLGQPLPPIHSRQAADITRRVMIWAAEYDNEEDVEDSRPIAWRAVGG